MRDFVRAKPLKWWETLEIMQTGDTRYIAWQVAWPKFKISPRIKSLITSCSKKFFFQAKFCFNELYKISVRTRVQTSLFAIYWTTFIGSWRTIGVSLVRCPVVHSCNGAQSNRFVHIRAGAELVTYPIDTVLVYSRSILLNRQGAKSCSAWSIPSRWGEIVSFRFFVVKIQLLERGWV